METDKKETLDFLDSLYRGHGFYAWSKHDIYSLKIRWGLGNTVFATKTYNLLGVEPVNKVGMARFITSFVTYTGDHIHDPLVYKKTWLRRKLRGDTRVAEKRQAYVALKMLNAIASFRLANLDDYNKILGSGYYKNISEIMMRLCKPPRHKKSFYTDPWHYGSIINHIVFFEALKTRELGWYLTNLDLLKPKASFNNIINGVMKVIMAINITNDLRRQSGNIFTKDDLIPIRNAKEIISLLEAHDSYSHGCDLLNAAYVMYYCCKQENYVPKNFITKHLYRIEKHNFNGGYGFYKEKKARKYYGLTVTKPFKGADIHGTYLLTWAKKLLEEMLEKK